MMLGIMCLNYSIFSANTSNREKKKWKYERHHVSKLKAYTLTLSAFHIIFFFFASLWLSETC